MPMCPVAYAGIARVMTERSFARSIRESCASLLAKLILSHGVQPTSVSLRPNGRDQRLATLGFPSGPILSRVRCIALLGASAEYMRSKRNVNHAKAVPVNACEPPDEKVMSLAEGANVLLVGVWAVISHKSLKRGRIGGMRAKILRKA